jgi:hypothetical protein
VGQSLGADLMSHLLPKKHPFHQRRELEHGGLRSGHAIWQRFEVWGHFWGIEINFQPLSRESINLAILALQETGQLRKLQNKWSVCSNAHLIKKNGKKYFCTVINGIFIFF